jgi:hypothetical protein
MSRLLTIFGLLTSAIYAIAGYFLVADRLGQLQTMPIDAVGNFLAGVFGPLALLWLILGYLQQGIELKLNTKALELQAQELQNSVTQQRELVEVSRKQFEAEMELLRYERHRIEEANKPRFVTEGVGGSHQGDGRSFFTLPVKNLGAPITNVSFQFSVPMQKVEPENLSHWIGDQTVRLHFSFIDWKATDCDLTVSYTDASGKSGTKMLGITADLSGSYPSLKVVRPDL